MGFLDKFSKTINIVGKTVAKGVESALEKAANTSADNTATQSQPATRQEAFFKMPAQPMSEEALLNRLRAVIGNDFPECQVQVNVVAITFDPTVHPMAKPLSLLVSNAGAPVLAIAVVTANNYRSMPVVSTKKAVEAQKIPYVRFFCEYENRTDYISNRLAGYLK